ncbi:MAG: efflux RND transporter periplasmic adaptor subunit [Hyphomicrobiaceae bacterium]|nr:efflux RND transporter periplasmic adaptor subunit [Hyphomicrobiaceae bacterium]
MTMPLVETTLVTGTLVPRDEILVAPEIDGLRVVELHADAGDRVQRGQLLATLEKATLEAQLAQSTASLARAEAAIAQARSQILQAEAAAKESAAAFDRAKPLNKDGFVSDAVRDQREAAARTSAAQLVAARDGLKVAEASKAELEAQHSNLLWRLGKAEVKAPRTGIVSRRTARIGGLASAVAEPMFRIIAEGQIELDAEATESRLARIKVDQKAIVEIAGVGNVEGTVRLVSPEVDRLTRLGSVRILLGDDPGLRIGAFGRGRIVTARTRGLAVPASAVLFGSDGAATVQRVIDGKVVVAVIRTGLRTEGSVEVISGLDEGAIVVAKAGTFLREGDLVRPVLPDERISAARAVRHDRGEAQTVDIGQ